MEDKSKNSLENFFNKYFYKNGDEYLGIILNKDISNFFKEEIISLEFFETFDNIFSTHPEIIPYVNKDFYQNKTYFELLINYYISNIKNESNAKLIFYIQNLLFYIEPSIEIFENIFQFIKKNIKNFDEKIFNSIFELLNILYENKSNKINSISFVPKNYIFHNGSNYIQLISKNNLITKDEFQIHLWFYFNYSNIKILKECSIVRFGFFKNIISINLTDFYTKICFTDSLDHKNKKIISEIKSKEWVYISVKLNSNKMEINLIQTNLNKKFEQTIHNDNLNFVFFFENFIGISTSILISQNKKKLNFKKPEYKMGFCKENLIKNYLIQNNNYLISFLAPIYFYFDEEENNFIIEDIFKNNDLRIIDNYSLINKKNNIKQIQFLGGIKSILPIFELIFINKEKNIFFQKNFENFFALINVILDKKNYSNFLNAIQEKFFESFSLFLEKIPNEYYSNVIYDNFIKLHDNFTHFLKKNPYFLKNKYSFLENIFINLNILFKFNFQNQNNIIKYFTIYYKDYNIIKNNKKIIDLNKMIIIFRKIDSEKYKGFCCEKHAKCFKNYDKNEILKPEISERLEIFSQIIINLMENSKENEILNFFKLLILDISPCLQDFLISNIILLYFHKITDEKKIKFYLKNDFFNILLYVYSISLIDIKISILNLLFVLFTHFPNLKNYVKFDNNLIDFSNFINLFLRENLMLNNLKINEFKENNEKNLSFNEKKSKNYLKYKKGIEIDINNKKSFDDFLINNNNNNSNFLIKKENNILETQNKISHNFTNKISNEEEIKNNNLNIINNEIKLLNDYFLFKFLNDQEKIKFKYLNNENFLLNLLDEKNYYLSIKSCFDQLKSFIKSSQINLIIELTIKIKLNFNKNDNIIKEFFSRIEDELDELEEILKSNYKFIDFLIRTLFNCLEEKENLMNLLKKLIFSNLNKESINIIVYILNWSYFEYKINIKNYDKIYKLVKNLLLNGIDYLIVLFDKKQFELNENNYLFFYQFMNLLYEFIITFNEKFLQETISKIKLKNYLEIDKDSHSIIPSFAINGQENYVNNYSWKNYEIFDKIITLFNKLFSIEYNEFNDINKINNLLNKICNKKESKEKKEKIEKKFEYLCGTFNYTNDHKLKEIKGLSIIIIISNLFLIYFCVDSDKKEVLENYEKFLMYLIISNLKNKKISQEFYENNLIVFLSCLLYLIDNISNDFYYQFIEKLGNIIIYNIFLEIKKKKKNNEKKEIKNIPILDDIILKIFFRYFSISKSVNNKYLDFFEYCKKYNLNINNDKSNNPNEIMDELLKNKEIHYKIKNLFNTKYLYFKYKERIKIFQKNSFLIIKNKNEENINFNNKNLLENNFDILYNYYLSKEKLLDKISNLTDFYIEIFYKNKKILNENYIKRKNIYKNIKKNLFSFNGLWSEKKLFFDKNEEKILKYKTVHHYSKELILPLTKIILDINYYLPKFSLFKKEKLFLNNQNFSIVNLDIEKILNSNFIINNKNSLNSNHNYLFNIYFYNTKNVIEKYKKIILIEKNEKIELSNDNFYLNILDKNNNYFKCCLVKISYHIKGFLKTGKNKLKFNYFNYDLSNDKYDYDYERKCCFGSFITNPEKDKNYKKIKINLDDITYILKRKYYYIDKALEIFTNKNKSYYFNFYNQKLRDKIIDYIINNQNFSQIKIISNENSSKENKEKIIGYSNLKYSNLIKNLEDLNNKYSNFEISTLHYLILNNLFSYRSFKDISQYPIFPWILMEYEKNIIDNNFNRDLKLPMGMLELNELGIERKTYYIQEYNNRKKNTNEEIFENFNSNKKTKKNKNVFFNSDAYFYGSTFSNPAYVSHYLVRIFPFTIVGIEIQGNNFDSSDRLFFNVCNSFKCAATQQCDLRELTPEFFYLPDFLYNLNSLNLNLSEEKQNVIIPNWCKDPFEFIEKHRKFLEKNLEIPNWINLLFGYKQQGKEAEKSCNIYLYHCYQNNVDLGNFKFKEDLVLYNRLFEIGVLPNQIYKEKKSISVRKENEKMKFIFKNKNIEINIELKKNFKLKKNVLNFKILNDSKKILFYYSNHLIHLLDFENKKILEYSNKENDEDFKKMNIIIESEVHKKIQFFNKLNYYILSENYGGTFLFVENNKKSEINKKIKELTFEKKSLITNISIDSEDKYVYISTSKGSLFKYEFTKKYDLLLKKQKNDHRSEIIHMFLNNDLQLLATAGKDKIINLYTLPKLKLNRSIKIDFIPSLIFISNGILPSLIVYNKYENNFLIYSINGMFINKINIQNKYKIVCYNIYKDCYCNEYLIIGSDQGIIEIFEFPFMKSVYVINKVEKNIKFINVLENGKKILYVLSEGEIFIISALSKEFIDKIFKENLKI